MPSNFKDVQKSFAAHIRDPGQKPAPEGVEDRRMQIYRDLFFNNISSMLGSNFPVLRELYEDADWQKLIRDFYSEHRCQTPLFPEIPKEFLRYLQDFRHDHPEDPPFLLELAHYEWVELALALDERNLDAVEADSEGDFLDDVPVLSPLAWPLSYRFPVHMIRPEYMPQAPPEEPTHLLVYRDRSHEVSFMQLNDVARYLLQLLQEGGENTGRELLRRVAQAINHPQPERLISAGLELMLDWHNKDILLGTRTATDV